MVEVSLTLSVFEVFKDFIFNFFLGLVRSSLVVAVKFVEHIDCGVIAGKFLLGVPKSVVKLLFKQSYANLSENSIIPMSLSS